MRDDQFQRLQTLSEKLTDVVLDEADPSSWPGDDMTTEKWRALELVDAKEAQRIRGDRYWSKKNAAATLTLLTKVYTIAGWVTQRNARSDGLPITDGSESDDMEKEIKDAEKVATKLLAQVQATAYGKAKR
jgi:hypothetical protein